MALNKFLSVLGGGLLSATLLLLILWSITSPPVPNNGPVLLIATGIEIYVLAALLSIFTGFILSLVTADEGIEKLYLGYGIFLGALLLLLAAGSAAFEGRNSVIGIYQFPTFLTFLTVDSIALAAITLLSAIGYGSGYLVRGIFKPAKTLAAPQ